MILAYFQSASFNNNGSNYSGRQAGQAGRHIDELRRPATSSATPSAPLEGAFLTPFSSGRCYGGLWFRYPRQACDNWLARIGFHRCRGSRPPLCLSPSAIDDWVEGLSCPAHRSAPGREEEEEATGVRANGAGSGGGGEQRSCRSRCCDRTVDQAVV